MYVCMYVCMYIHIYIYIYIYIYMTFISVCQSLQIICGSYSEDLGIFSHEALRGCASLPPWDIAGAAIRARVYVPNASANRPSPKPTDISIVALRCVCVGGKRQRKGRQRERETEKKTTRCDNHVCEYLPVPFAKWRRCRPPEPEIPVSSLGRVRKVHIVKNQTNKITTNTKEKGVIGIKR